MTEIVIDLPAPPRECSPNSGAGRSRHWWHKAKAAKQYRADCVNLLAYGPQKALRPPVPISRCEVAVEWHTGAARGIDADGLYHPRDSDNATAASKQNLDAIVAAGFLKDDSKRVILRSSFTWHTTKAEKGQPRPASFVRYRIRTIEE